MWNVKIVRSVLSFLTICEKVGDMNHLMKLMMMIIIQFIIHLKMKFLLKILLIIFMLFINHMLLVIVCILKH